MTARQGVDCLGIGEIEFEKYVVDPIEGSLHHGSNVGPDPSVGHMNGTEEIGGGIALNLPQERTVVYLEQRENGKN